MTLAEAIISGIVQGVTEFLPVSSSGHLALLHNVFHLGGRGIFFDVCLHAGTLAAIIVYFSRDIRSLVLGKQHFWLSCITVGTIPACIFAVLFDNKISSYFGDPRKVGFMFLGTAMFLFAAQLYLALKARRELSGQRDLRGHSDDISIKNSLMVGLAQAFALFPGISRSGVTISTGIVRGMRTDTAFRFSFLLAIPIIAGAVIYEAAKNMFKGDMMPESPFVYVAGTVTAFLVGLATLPLLLKAVKAHRLYIFGIYCLVLGVAGMVFLK
ncbi:MAG: hypothetical protein DRP08_06120 [Candidatus Aenigmatarchaeota archaeon]|nr:MAG: hypothetical protein DRP08_06120 [Candidatus Aenigmarchaeota archaeon]